MRVSLDLRLSGRAARDPLEGTVSALCCVRQTAAGQLRGHRREQTTGRGFGLDQGAPGRPASPVGGSGRAPTLEPEVWPDEKPRRPFGAGRPVASKAGTPGPPALRSECLRTAAPGSVSPGLTDMSTLRKP